jgi:hypothetical protein
MLINEYREYIIDYYEIREHTRKEYTGPVTYTP